MRTHGANELALKPHMAKETVKWREHSRSLTTTETDTALG